MKLPFNRILNIILFFLIASQGQAKDIVLITHFKQKKQTELIRRIINEKFFIPNRFIKTIETNKPCKLERSSLFHFCIDKQKELRTLKKSPGFYRNNLKVFREI